MTLLITGLILFAILHLIPFWGRSIRDGAIGVIGLNPYKGLFALASFGSLWLVGMGYGRVEEVTYVYEAPVWGMHVTPLFVLAGFILFIASNAPTNIRRAVRHPQLTGVVLWGIGHLFSNGETPAVILFGGFTVFSILAMIGSNQRDGDWVKREKVSVIKDGITVFIALFLYALFAYFHGWIIGVPAV